LCAPRKHNCQPFCGPEGRFYCSDSVCSLRPVPFSYLCVRVRILCVLKIVYCCRIKPDCRMPAVVSIFTDSAACVLSFYHSTPSHIKWYLSSPLHAHFIRPIACIYNGICHRTLHTHFIRQTACMQ